MGEGLSVRVFVYRHGDEPYTVENPDISPLPFTIEPGIGVSVMVRADTTVGPKWVAVRVEREAAPDELAATLTRRLAYPFVNAEMPVPSADEIERRLAASDFAWMEARSTAVQARREQYMNAIEPRLTEAWAAA